MPYSKKDLDAPVSIIEIIVILAPILYLVWYCMKNPV